MEKMETSAESMWSSFVQSGDVRANALPLIQEPAIVIFAVVAYLAIVKLGPQFMEKREAWDLRKVIIVYNFCCVVASLWMFWEVFATTILNPSFNLYYEEYVETDTSDMTIRLINAHWWYFASKLIEFLDTFFFILRKKNNQISFLHVYHHVTMVMITWSMVKFTPGAAVYIGPLCNTFIHAVMYTYYMLAAVGPHMQKYLWWKRYLTRMQLTQFCIVFAYCTMLICMNLKGVFLFFAWLKWGYMVTLMILFGNFYVKAYMKANKKTD